LPFMQKARSLVTMTDDTIPLCPQKAAQLFRSRHGIFSRRKKKQQSKRKTKKDACIAAPE
jgi:hypothetical protein